MRQIIERIEKIKVDEDYFKSGYWKDNFVSYKKGDIYERKHISEVDFESLNDDDLVRLFEYIILCKSDISLMRVNEFFKNNKL